MLLNYTTSTISYAQVIVELQLIHFQIWTHTQQKLKYYLMEQESW